MKNKMIACSFIVFSIIMSGCQQSENDKENQGTETEEVKAPRVEILAKEQVNKGEEVSIGAHVYYGEELVDDAEVTFEIKLGENSEKIDAKLVDKGTYEIDYLFKEDGSYQVTAHTNVKSYHTMPTLEILVGEGQLATTTNDHEDHSEGDHHHSSVTINVDELTKFQVNKEEQLSTTILEGDQPFSDATVRFEIWKEGQEHHQYIDAAESTTKGMYTSSYKFDEAGMYKIVVHVEKGEVHDHIETSVEVQ
jgi:hypothetical protein